MRTAFVLCLLAAVGIATTAAGGSRPVSAARTPSIDQLLGSKAKISGGYGYDRSEYEEDDWTTVTFQEVQDENCAVVSLKSTCAQKPDYYFETVLRCAGDYGRNQDAFELGSEQPAGRCSFTTTWWNNANNSFAIDATGRLTKYALVDFECTLDCHAPCMQRAGFRGETVTLAGRASHYKVDGDLLPLYVTTLTKPSMDAQCKAYFADPWGYAAGECSTSARRAPAGLGSAAAAGGRVDDARGVAAAVSTAAASASSSPSYDGAAPLYKASRVALVSGTFDVYGAASTHFPNGFLEFAFGRTVSTSDSQNPIYTAPAGAAVFTPFTFDLRFFNAKAGRY